MERISTAYANEQLSSFAETFKNGVLAIYSGTQPASADDAETGTLLCLITNDSGAFTPGQPTNGLNFGAPVNGQIDKAAGETWSGTVLADGVAGWFRFYDNSYTTGASTTAKRFDGAIADTGACEIQITNTTLAEDDGVGIQGFHVVYPTE